MQIMTDQTRTTTGGGYWPVYKGASFNLWEPDTGTYYASVDADEISKHLQEKRVRSHKLKRSPFSEFTETHIADPATLPCKHPRIAFRNTTNPTNTRTVIAALVPGDRVIANSAPYLLRPHSTPRDEAYLLGILSSMILDWYARRVVELNVNFHILNNFPIPDFAHTDDPEAGVVADPVAARVVDIAGCLAAVDERFAGWADAVGVPVGTAKDPHTKQKLIYELDACVAHLYGLDENDLKVLYETFHEKADYSQRYLRVLEYFKSLQSVKSVQSDIGDREAE